MNATSPLKAIFLSLEIRSPWNAFLGEMSHKNIDIQCKTTKLKIFIPKSGKILCYTHWLQGISTFCKLSRTQLEIKSLN